MKCNTEETNPSIPFYKHISYKWQRAGYRPLYLNFHQDNNGQGDALSEITVSKSASDVCHW